MFYKFSQMISKMWIDIGSSSTWKNTVKSSVDTYVLNSVDAGLILHVAFIICRGRARLSYVCVHAHTAATSRWRLMYQIIISDVGVLANNTVHIDASWRVPLRYLYV